MLSTVAAPVFIPTNSALGFPFLHNLASTFNSYELNVCDPLKFLCLNPSPWCDDTGKWSLWKVISLQIQRLPDEISTFVWRDRKVISLFLCQVQIKWNGPLQAGRGHLPDTVSAVVLILAFPNYKTVINKCYLNQPIYGIFFIVAQVDWDNIYIYAINI